MVGDRLSADVAPLFFKLDSKMDVSSQAVQPGHITAREQAGIWRLSALSDLDVLEKR